MSHAFKSRSNVSRLGFAMRLGYPSNICSLRSYTTEKNGINQLLQSDTSSHSRISSKSSYSNSIVNSFLKKSAFTPSLGSPFDVADLFYVDPNQIESFKLKEFVQPEESYEYIDSITNGEDNILLSWDHFKTIARRLGPKAFDHTQYFLMLEKIKQDIDVNKLAGKAGTMNPKYLEISRSVHELMVKADYNLDSCDYRELILIESKFGKSKEVEKLWLLLNEEKIAKDSTLYDAYILASCHGRPALWNIAKYLPKTDQTKIINPTVYHEPNCFEDPLSLVSAMADEGVLPTVETYNALVTSIGKSGDLKTVKAIIKTIWAIEIDKPVDRRKLITRSSVNYPNHMTLTAIIHTFGYNDRVAEGLRFIEKFSEAYHINLFYFSTGPIWEALLRWSYHTTTPKGNTPVEAIESIWSLLRQQRKLQPSGSSSALHTNVRQTVNMYKYLVLSKRDNEDYQGMLGLIPQIINGIKNPKDCDFLVGKVMLMSIKGFAQFGEMEKCDEILSKYSNYSVEATRLAKNYLVSIQNNELDFSDFRMGKGIENPNAEQVSEDGFFSTNM
ncbi:hypothetical protein NADFUDRAFT_41803 [Nadsonia fulvescens var. elongata DSM 6958]|uniref:ATPase expression protein 2, mitochondrial n=1 Tax=Nadsonia fulvescens var. elongata DSM 6958 TaxID=857566 RepID=A0A1E3PKU3_9ASCO|nr:hypothetical protein NADFUDRAFT_41803 [Nadsonia fulvescens var. elongata DSM 6958]